MFGAWLNKSEASSSLGLTWAAFSKKLTEFKSKSGPHGSCRYFIPYSQMTPQAQTNLKARLEELPDDDFASELAESILGDVSHGSLEGAMGIPLDLDSQLQAAQLDNIKARTKMLR